MLPFPAADEAGAAAGRCHNLFFAAVPPPEVAARMADAWERHGTGRRFRGGTLHLSLIQVLSRPGDISPAAVRSGSAAAAVRHRAFDLAFDRLAAFGGTRSEKALVLATGGASAEADRLAARLRLALGRTDQFLGRCGRVTPHVTLAYGPAMAMRRLRPPIRWRVTEFSLIDSHVGETRHVVLGTWALAEG